MGKHKPTRQSITNYEQIISLNYHTLIIISIIITVVAYIITTLAFNKSTNQYIVGTSHNANRLFPPVPKSRLYL
jgi:hypothetical protein